MPILEFLIRLGAALLMGAVVGLERQWRQRRTASSSRRNGQGPQRHGHFPGLGGPPWLPRALRFGEAIRAQAQERSPSRSLRGDRNLAGGKIMVSSASW
jgi:hypothetical protein